MTRHAREAVALTGATALGEVALQALVTTEWSAVGGHVFLFTFLIGPTLFLAVLAWRRREHPTRSRVLFGLAVVVAFIGLGTLGVTLYRFDTDAEFRRAPNMSGLIVPLVQWGAIGAVWLWLVIQETQEKRLARQAAQASGSAGRPGTSNGPTKPSQPA